MIKKRNLDNSLIQWIMTVSGLGPGIGEIKYLTDAASATSQFITQLQTMGVDDADIFTTLTTAEDATTGYRNDIVIVMPEQITENASVTWDKNHTHIIGIGNPMDKNFFGDTGALIYNSSSDVAQILNLTAHRCRFVNMAFRTHGDDTAVKCAVKESGRHNYFRDCSIVGLVGSSTVDQTDCTNLWINTPTGGAGNGDRFERCVIGDSGGGTRTAKNGTVYFGATGAAGSGNGMVFQECSFEQRAEDTNPAAFLIAANYCLDRMLLLDNCVFYNFSNNHGIEPAYVIRDGCNTTHDIVLKNCAHQGFTAWTDNATHCFNATSAANTSGGEATAADTS